MGEAHRDDEPAGRVFGLRREAKRDAAFPRSSGFATFSPFDAEKELRLERVATAKAITLRIPQLKDCKNHFDRKKEKGKGTMVFICEGQSAGSSGHREILAN